MSAPEPNVAPAPARTFWQRRVRDPIVAQLTQGITPEKIALTLAVGSAFALFPILGTTTVLCFIVAIALRLNQPIVQLINQALWPVHIPVIFGCIRLGETIFGAPRAEFHIRWMREMIWSRPAEFFHQFGLTVLYAVVAWCVVAPFFITAVYFIALPVTRRVTYLKHTVETTTADQTPPPTP
ncbi:MAG: DUF2062 domain-containing protein [Verrucomicrobia bacterium]|nr:DUF2062 domain-containing protein [Verrucomicrobiota bacterium]